MKCEKCGKELVEGAAFCAFCGRKICYSDINEMETNAIPVDIKSVIDSFVRRLDYFADNINSYSKVYEVLKSNDALGPYMKEQALLILSYYMCEIIIRNGNYSKLEARIHRYFDDEFELKEQCDLYENDIWFKENLCYDPNSGEIGIELNKVLHIISACDICYPDLFMYKLIDDFDTILQKVLYLKPNPTDEAIEYYNTSIDGIRHLHTMIMDAFSDNCPKDEFIPDEETKQVKEYLETTESFLAQFPITKELFDSLYSGLLLYALSFVLESINITERRLEIINYWFGDVFEEKFGEKANRNILYNIKSSGMDSLILSSINDMNNLRNSISSLENTTDTNTLSTVFILLLTHIANVIITCDSYSDDLAISRAQRIIDETLEHFNIQE